MIPFCIFPSLADTRKYSLRNGHTSRLASQPANLISQASLQTQNEWGLIRLACVAGISSSVQWGGGERSGGPACVVVVGEEMTLSTRSCFLQKVSQNLLKEKKKSQAGDAVASQKTLGLNSRGQWEQTARSLPPLPREARKRLGPRLRMTCLLLPAADRSIFVLPEMLTHDKRTVRFFPLEQTVSVPLVPQGPGKWRY